MKRLSTYVELNCMWKSKVKRIYLPSYFLHGFTGSTTSWREITKLLKGNYQTIAVDLTGHGKSTIPEDIDRYSMDQQVEDLEELFTELSLDQFILVGYSMGGRVALAYTVRHSKRVSSLILESSSPGLKTEEEREERQEADRRLGRKNFNGRIASIHRFLGKYSLVCISEDFVGRKTAGCEE